MQTHIERYHLAVSATTEADYSRLGSMGRGSVFYLDFEFSRTTAGSRIALELAVLDWKGELVLSTAIDHGLSVADIYKFCAVGDFSRLKTIQRLHGPPSEEKMEGMKPEEIAKVLVSHGFSQSSLIVEWSTSGCDYHLLKDLMSTTSYAASMPPATNSRKCVWAWREALPGFVSFSLSVAFTVVCGFGGNGQQLLLNKHTAEADVKMTYRIMDVFCQEITKKGLVYQKSVNEYFTEA
jgi:hypothetical protein